MPLKTPESIMGEIGPETSSFSFSFYLPRRGFSRQSSLNSLVDAIVKSRRRRGDEFWWGNKRR
jgi:hypothetical protein